MDNRYLLTTDPQTTQTGGSFPGEWSGRGVKLTIRHQLVPTLRMRGAIPPFPHTSHGVLLN